MRLDKNKIKEVLLIKDIVERYSDKYEVRGKTITFLCPFHDDHKLGSCWAYLDAHAFTCSACNERADVLKLASRYTGIPLYDLNSLLERIASDFNLTKEQFAQDGNLKFTGYTKLDASELLTEEEYERLLGVSCLKKPAEFKKVVVAGVKKQIVSRYETVTFPALAKRDSAIYDAEVLNRSRIVWDKLRTLSQRAKTNADVRAQVESLFWTGGLCSYADEGGTGGAEIPMLKERRAASEILDAIIGDNEILLKKALINKALYEDEIALRRQIEGRERLKSSILSKI